MIIEISPESATITAGQSQEYRVTRYTPSGRAKDVTKRASFAIEDGAGGSWNKSAYSSENVGSWQVTATYRRSSVIAMLNVEREPSKAMLYGRVTDAKTSLPIGEIDVKCNGYTGKTDSNGNYEIISIAAGTYNVVFSDALRRYKEVTNMGIILEPGEPERLDVELYPLPELPQSIEGSVWHTRGAVGQLGSKIAFVYRKNSQAWLYLDGMSYLLPDSPTAHSHPYKTILTADYIWLVEEASAGIKVHQYELSGSEIVLENSFILTGSDSDSDWGDVILLSSGKLVIAWYQEGASSDLSVHFALGNENGWTCNYGIMPESHATRNRCIMAQHPVDGSIWYFQVSDSRGQLYAMRLEENLEITDIFSPLIPYHSPLRPEGEQPNPRAVATSDSILVAYQSRDYHQFSISPFIKGAYINVISVDELGNYSLRAMVNRYIERISNFCLGVVNDQFWLAFAEIDPVTYEWDILKIYFEDETERYLGIIKAISYAGGKGVLITNSTDMVIPWMADNMIHFYPI